MQQTFLQKVIFTIVLGFIAAGVIYISNSFFDDVNISVGNQHKNSSSSPR